MRIEFSKMHGLGNDFVVIDAKTKPLHLDEAQIRQLAMRRYGIGCDQVLIVEASEKADFRYRIYNADGGEVAQCGNGARCFMDFVRRRGLTHKTTVSLETSNGMLEVTACEDSFYSVSMGVPQLAPERVPFIAADFQTEYHIEVDGEVYTLGAVSMGNPHAVLLVDNVDQAPVASLGPKIEMHSRFPQRVNVGFLEIRDRRHASLRVWERGVGETHACGSGACAAVVSGRLRGLFDAEVEMQLLGGVLHVTWSDENAAVIMRGPASHVFDGVIEI